MRSQQLGASYVALDQSVASTSQLMLKLVPLNTSFDTYAWLEYEKVHSSTDWTEGIE